MSRARLAVSVGTVLALLGGALAAADPAAAATASAAAPATAPAPAAPAAALKAFDAADIISDGVMYNSGSMTVGAIQAFLEAQVPVCQAGYVCLKDYRQTTVARAADPMCATYPSAVSATAATIVKNVATACGINPQALLVILQKEEGLVQDASPNAGQYRIAMGYGCPDTAACDTKYYGFANQVYMAAWALKRYTSPPGTTGPGWLNFNWYPVGRPSAVLYNPNPKCGSKVVTIKNEATASLYYYTPYTPNAAALAAGWGAAPCGAYGNRNFYLYFTTWFGSTHYVATGRIGALVKAMSAAERTALGAVASSPVTATYNGGGTYQRFAHGVVYDSKAGTVAVDGTAYTEYRARKGPKGPLGWPLPTTTTRTVNGGGRILHLQHGDVFATATTAAMVNGRFRVRYDDGAGVAGTLGWPLADAVHPAGGGVYQQFQHGGLYLTKGGALHAVHGDFSTEYLRLGGVKSSLGWPTGEAVSRGAHRGGTSQSFNGGGIYRSTAGVFAVLGRIGVTYASHGGLAGTLGWPLEDARTAVAYGIGGGSQRFNGGTVLWSRTGGTHSLAGAVLQAYERRGGQGGVLGWPTSAVTAVKAHGGGTATSFQSGGVYASKAGVFVVRGTILAAYTAAQGPSGALGWPKGSAKRTGAVVVQAFQHGDVTVTDGSAPVVHRS